MPELEGAEWAEDDPEWEAKELAAAKERMWRLETMTVAMLKAKLSEYPDDMPVKAEWEGYWKQILPENFAVDSHDPILIINVEYDRHNEKAPEVNDIDSQEDAN